MDRLTWLRSVSPEVGSPWNPVPTVRRLARSFVERDAVAYDGTGNDGRAGHERYARDGSLSETESA